MKRFFAAIALSFLPFTAADAETTKVTGPYYSVQQIRDFDVSDFKTKMSVDEVNAVMKSAGGFDQELPANIDNWGLRRATVSKKDTRQSFEFFGYYDEAGTARIWAISGKQWLFKDPVDRTIMRDKLVQRFGTPTTMRDTSYRGAGKAWVMEYRVKPDFEAEKAIEDCQSQHGGLAGTFGTFDCSAHVPQEMMERNAISKRLPSLLVVVGTEAIIVQLQDTLSAYASEKIIAERNAAESAAEQKNNAENKEVDF